MPRGIPGRTHGKGATYRKGGCRCTPCRTAHADDWRRWYQAKQRKARADRQPDLLQHHYCTVCDQWIDRRGIATHDEMHEREEQAA